MTDRYPYGRPAWPHWTSPVWWLYFAAVLCSCSVTLTDAQISSAAGGPCRADVLPVPEATAEIEATGRTVSVRRSGRGATTLPGRVLLPPDWETRSRDGRERLLAHERTHVCQQGDRAAAWVLRYALDAEARVLAELEAIAAQAAGSSWCATIVEDKIQAIPARYHVRWDAAWMRGTLIPMATHRACGE